MSQRRFEHHTLYAENLVRRFKKRTVVNDVSFSVSTGQVIGLLGPNGAGKTTSFYMVVGLLFPDQGRVLIDKENITALPMHVRAKQGISYLPQNTSIFRRMTVTENLLSVMEVCEIDGRARTKFLEELLEKFRISHIRDSLGASLSGGERRRVEIARALIIKPKFLLLDEPFAGIDPVTVQEIQQIILSLKEEGLGVLITDHNVRETLDSCDKVFILSQGEVIANGGPKEIYENQMVREAYLGENFKA
jgi:lipopolysaccharide export system ATP-binding protein